MLPKERFGDTHIKLHPVSAVSATPAWASPVSDKWCPKLKNSAGFPEQPIFGFQYWGLKASKF